MASNRSAAVPWPYVLDSLFAFVGVLSPDGTLIEANRLPLEVAGVTAADVLGKPFWECYWWSYAPDVQARLRDSIARALAGEVVRYDVQVRTAGDARMWIDFQLAPLRDAHGRITHLIPSGMDITARRETEKALRLARDTFSHLVENSPFGVYAVDADFRLVQVSVGAQKVFENVRPLLGRDFAEVLRIIWAEPFASEAIALFRHTLATGEPYHAPSTVERRRDIDDIEAYDWKIERVTLPDGRYGVVCHFYDLSERQRDEAALKKAEAVLREAARQKDEFIAVLAHELRNPLAPIRTAVALMRSQGDQDPLLNRCRDVVDRQVASMARLLDDLLDVSRLSRGKLTLQSADLSLADVLDAAVETARPIIDQQECHLTYERPAESVLVHGDAARLTQVFGNLLNNAAKYNRPGGQIEISVTTGDAGVAVTIADSGIGLTPEFLSRAFELFTQASSARDLAPGGLGIGLALARQLVELHGGTIRASSAGVGQGSRFTVSLPIVATRAAQAAAGRTSGAHPHLGVRVLLAEDNVDAADMLTALLEHFGCDVATVHDGLEALRRAEEFRPAVALLDIGMPGLDGYEVCRRLRASPWAREVKIVALTGWGQDEDRRRSAEAGFDRHLVKPVAPDVLLETLRGA